MEGTVWLAERRVWLRGASGKVLDGDVWLRGASWRVVFGLESGVFGVEVRLGEYMDGGCLA